MLAHDRRRARYTPSADILSPKMKEAAGAHQGPGDLRHGQRSERSNPGDHAGRCADGWRALFGGEYLPLALRTEDFRPRLQLSGASPERTEPTPLLNHETSDHLLSQVEERAWLAATDES